MPDPDDKLDADAEAGTTDAAAQARRFKRVANILQRAINRYNQISSDIGAAGPAADPAVQAALQAIDTNAAAVINLVLSQPGPVQDPIVRATVQGIADIGTQLKTDAEAKLGGVVGGPVP